MCQPRIFLFVQRLLQLLMLLVLPPGALRASAPACPPYPTPATVDCSCGAATCVVGQTCSAGLCMFPPSQYTISASSDPNGNIVPSGSVTVNAGSNQSFSMMQSPGFHVGDVLVDGVSVGTVTWYDFTNVTANHTISVSFAPDAPFIISASAGAGGSINPSGSVAVANGGNQNFYISPSPGYQVSNVVVDSVSFGVLSFYAFSNVTANHTIDATFVAAPPPTCPAWPATTSTTCTCGAAVCTSGQGCNAGVCQAPSLIITANSGPNGNIVPSGSISVIPGGNQNFSMMPSPGYHVDNVYVDTFPIGAVTSYTFNNVTASHGIDVTFAPDAVQYTITASAGPNGSITPGGSVSVLSGGNQSFSITPDANYLVADVQVDGTSVGATTSYLFNNVTADHVISASFGSTSTVCPAWPAIAGENCMCGTRVCAAGLSCVAADNSCVIPLPNCPGSPGAASEYCLCGVDGLECETGMVCSLTGPSPACIYPPPAACPAAPAQNTEDACNCGPGVDGPVICGYGATCNPSVYPAVCTPLPPTPNCPDYPGISTANCVCGQGEESITCGSGDVCNTTVTPPYCTVPPPANCPAWPAVSADYCTCGTSTCAPGNGCNSGTCSIPQFTITAAPGASGTIVPSGSVVVNGGGAVDFEITPGTGFQVADVLVDGSSVGAVDHFQFSNVTGNHTIYPTFVLPGLPNCPIWPAEAETDCTCGTGPGAVSCGGGQSCNTTVSPPECITHEAPPGACPAYPGITTSPCLCGTQGALICAVDQTCDLSANPPACVAPPPAPDCAPYPALSSGNCKCGSVAGSSGPIPVDCGDQQQCVTAVPTDTVTTEAAFAPADVNSGPILCQQRIELCPAWPAINNTFGSECLCADQNPNPQLRSRVTARCTWGQACAPRFYVRLGVPPNTWLNSEVTCVVPPPPPLPRCYDDVQSRWPRTVRNRCTCSSNNETCTSSPPQACGEGTGLMGCYAVPACQPGVTLDVWTARACSCEGTTNCVVGERCKGDAGSRWCGNPADGNDCKNSQDCSSGVCSKIGNDARPGGKGTCVAKLLDTDACVNDSDCASGSCTGTAPNKTCAIRSCDDRPADRKGWNPRVDGSSGDAGYDSETRTVMLYKPSCNTTPQTMRVNTWAYSFDVDTFAIIGKTLRGVAWVDTSSEHQGVAFGREQTWQWVRTVTETDTGITSQTGDKLCRRTLSPERRVAGSGGHALLDPPIYNHGRTIYRGTQENCAYQFGKKWVTNGEDFCAPVVGEAASQPPGTRTTEVDFAGIQVEGCLQQIKDGACDSLCGSCKYSLPQSIIAGRGYHLGAGLKVVDPNKAAYVSVRDARTAATNTGGNVQDKQGGHNSNNDAHFERLLYDECLQQTPRYWKSGAQAPSGIQTMDLAARNTFCTSTCNTLNTTPTKLGVITSAPSIAWQHGFPDSSVGAIGGNNTTGAARVEDTCRIGSPYSGVGGFNQDRYGEYNASVNDGQGGYIPTNHSACNAFMARNWPSVVPPRRNTSSQACRWSYGINTEQCRGAPGDDDPGQNPTCSYAITPRDGELPPATEWELGPGANPQWDPPGTNPPVNPRPENGIFPFAAVCGLG